MTKQEKSLKLAELMGWEVYGANNNIIQQPFERTMSELQPYLQTTYGLAQFAAIILKFPMVMTHLIEKPYRKSKQYEGEEDFRIVKKPTQEQILDEILKMTWEMD